jgi:hypothetical protein
MKVKANIIIHGYKTKTLAILKTLEEYKKKTGQ